MKEKDKKLLNEITVIEINKPTKEEAQKKVEELSKFLSKYWSTRNNSITDKPKTKKITNRKN